MVKLGEKNIVVHGGIDFEYHASMQYIVLVIKGAMLKTLSWILYNKEVPHML